MKYKKHIFLPVICTLAVIIYSCNNSVETKPKDVKISKNVEKIPALPPKITEKSLTCYVDSIRIDTAGYTFKMIGLFVEDSTMYEKDEVRFAIPVNEILIIQKGDSIIYAKPHQAECQLKQVVTGKIIPVLKHWIVTLGIETRGSEILFAVDAWNRSNGLEFSQIINKHGVVEFLLYYNKAENVSQQRGVFLDVLKKYNIKYETPFILGQNLQISTSNVLWASREDENKPPFSSKVLENSFTCYVDSAKIDTSGYTLKVYTVFVEDTTMFPKTELRLKIPVNQLLIIQKGDSIIYAKPHQSGCYLKKVAFNKTVPVLKHWIQKVGVMGKGDNIAFHIEAGCRTDSIEFSQIINIHGIVEDFYYRNEYEGIWIQDGGIKRVYDRHNVEYDEFYVKTPDYFKLFISDTLWKQ